MCINKYIKYILVVFLCFDVLTLGCLFQFRIMRISSDVNY